MRNQKRKRVSELHGQYANYFKVGHNAAEFVIDLGQFYPDNGAARLHTRIITGPAYAKALADLLADSIDKYEKSHGDIEGSAQSE